MPSEEIEPIYGMSEDDASSLETLVTGTAELVEGGLAECDITILGFGTQKGGETKMREGTNEEYETRDQIHIHLRVDDWEDRELDNPFTVQRITIPKEIVKNGRSQRATPTRASSWGIYLSQLERQGVSKVPEAATTYQIKGTGPRDLIGLKGHRSKQMFEAFEGGAQFPVAVIVDVYGFDNEVRAQAGLAPAYLVGQEPANPLDDNNVEEPVAAGGRGRRG